MNKIKLYGLMIVIFTALLSLIPTISYGANAMVTGSGSKDAPYVIDMSQVTATQITVDGHTISNAKVATIEITNAKLKEMAKEKNEDKKGFWFEFVNDDGGTFYVIYKKDENNVTFIKINDEKTVLSGTNNYAQAGAMPEGTNAEDTFSDTTFIIKSEEKTFGNNQAAFSNGKATRNYQLKNAPKPYSIGGQGLDVPDPACFVFTHKEGTVKSFYEEHSKKRYPGTTNYINYTGVKDWDSPFTTRGKIAELKLYPNGMGTGVSNFGVKFGSYSNKGQRNIDYSNIYKLNVKYQFRLANVPTPVENAGVIETAITWILIAVGEIFMFAIKLFLGNSVTIDSIIFNRYADVIIDLRGTVGPFSVPAVKDIINSMYNGFQFLAIVFNLVVLLYIGVQIIMTVGTDKQSKYTKNLQNWVVGVLILFMAPQFFPFLTDITNGIISYIGQNTQPMYTQYNIIALLNDEELLGENAQTVDLEEKIENKIEGNQEAIDEKQSRLDLVQTAIDAIRVEMESKKAEVEQKQTNIEAKLSDRNLKIIKLNKFDEYMDSLLTGPFSREFKERMDYSRYIDEMLNYIDSNKEEWDATDDSNFQEMLDRFKSVWENFERNGANGLPGKWRPNCHCNLTGGVPGIGAMPGIGGLPGVSGHNLSCEMTSYAPYTEGKNLVMEIKNLQLEAARLENEIEQLQIVLEPYYKLQAEIDELQAEIDMLIAYQTYGNKADLMSTMRTNAGKTGRVIYAIVWLILIFQMITLLAMYYKRIIMVAILIMIFPIVMITYAIDKIGDGAAQTLENWTKEFTINILVQIAHAIIYVTLIQTGLDIYAANQDNWIFLLIAVLFLFPGERLLRSIFGLNGSTIGSLKANIGGAIAMGATAGGAAFKLGKGAVKGAKAGIKGGKNLADNIKNKGVKGTANDMWRGTKKAIRDGWKNLGKDDEKDAKDKKKQAVADRKKRARDTNIERRREQMKTAGAAKKAMLGAVNAASHVRNGMYKVGNATRKATRSIHGMKKNNVGKAFKLAGKGIKGGIKGVRKLSGATMGIAAGVTNGLAIAGSKGVSAGVAQGIQQGKAVNELVGGPKAKQKPNEKDTKNTRTAPNTPINPNAKKMPGGQKYKSADGSSTRGKQRDGVRVVGRTSRKIRGTRKVNKTVNKKTNVKESNS